MTRSTTDHSVFYHHTSSRQCIYLIVYVDDIVIMGNDQDGIQSKSSVVMNQRKHALEILEETGILVCKPVDTPMNPNVKLIPGQGEPLRNPERYRQLVGKLNYLTITEPDISFIGSVVSQFLQSPYDSHWDVVIHILRYTKGTPSQGCYMKTDVTPRLSHIVMQTEQVHQQIDAPLMGIVYLLVKTQYTGRVRNMIL